MRPSASLPSSRTGDAFIEHNGGCLVLSAPMSKLRLIQQKYGRPFREVLTAAGLDEIIMSELLEILQEGSEFTADEIGEWLFGNLAQVLDPVLQTKMEKAFSILMGIPYQGAVAKAQATQKKGKAASTATKTS